MGDCKYCGQPAGWFGDAHKECEAEYRRVHANRHVAMGAIRDVVSAGLNDTDLPKLRAAIQRASGLQQTYSLDVEDMKRAFVEAVEQKASRYVADAVFTSVEQEHLLTAMEICDISIADFANDEIRSRVAVFIICRQLDQGLVYPLDRAMSRVNLTQAEHIVWIFKDIVLSHEKTKRRHVGGSQGLSIRLAKGLTYRVGSQKGESISEEVIEEIDQGNIEVTTDALYFVGDRKSLRLPLSKMVSIVDFDDAIAVDNANGKRYYFACSYPDLLLQLLQKVIRFEGTTVEEAQNYIEDDENIPESEEQTDEPQKSAGREADHDAETAIPFKMGSVVLACAGPMEGWFESVVVGIKRDRAKLKWRDWPDEPTFSRRLKELAQLPSSET